MFGIRLWYYESKFLTQPDLEKKFQIVEFSKRALVCECTKQVYHEKKNAPDFFGTKMAQKNGFLELSTEFCLYGVPLLLNGFGNLLAYVADLFVTSVCRWLSVRV